VDTLEPPTRSASVGCIRGVDTAPEIVNRFRITPTSWLYVRVHADRKRGLRAEPGGLRYGRRDYAEKVAPICPCFAAMSGTAMRARWMPGGDRPALHDLPLYRVLNARPEYGSATN
jgi:hypothetical protein